MKSQDHVDKAMKLMFSLFLSLLSVCLWAQQRDSIKHKGKPVVFINGKPADSVQFSPSDRIDYVKGKQAVELAGPRGKDGVLLVSSDGKIPVRGVVMNSRGKGLKNVDVCSPNGTVLTTTSRKGEFSIDAISLHEVLLIRKKGFREARVEIITSEQKIKLVKK